MAGAAAVLCGGLLTAQRAAVQEQERERNEKIAMKNRVVAPVGVSTGRGVPRLSPLLPMKIISFIITASSVVMLMLLGRSLAEQNEQTQQTRK